MKEFDTDVYNIMEDIPSGQVITYGQIARLAGKPQWARMVGQALGRVPEALQLPCHRVVNSEGRLVPGWESNVVCWREKASHSGKTDAWT